MSALLRKEVRLLWPSWAAAVLMAFSICLAPKNQNNASDLERILVVIPIIACPMMLVIMALSSFGREITANTFSNLLTQPVPRARIWWTKTLLLAAAAGIVWSVWWFSFLQTGDFRRVPHEEIRNALVITILLVLAAYSGGLWTVLLFRQVAAGFWFTILLPAAIMMMIEYLIPSHTGWVPNALIIAFSIYSLAGFLFARWLFLRAQDVHWTGGAITLPGWRNKTAAVSKRETKRRHPWRVLLAKEIHLHQSQLIIAVILAVLHLGVIAVRKSGMDLKGHLILEILLDGFWLLWFVMPLLVGCDAVAEERKLGTLEAQLCLPVRRRTQFVIKFVTTLLLAVLLGVVMPVLFEGARILPSGFSNRAGTPIGTILFGDFALYLDWTIPFLFLAGIAALTATISFYASTLARSTVQAIAPAILGIILTWFSLLAGESIHSVLPLWRGWLGYIIGVPVMALVLFGLMYWNFKRVLVGWSVWRRNIFVLMVSLAFVATATAALYNRVWEFLAPIEPAHGAARVAVQNATLKSDGSTVVVQLADGRVWATRFEFSVPLMAPHALKDGRYLPGTNWASVDPCIRDFVGIQKDGSLWILSEPQLAAGKSTSTSHWTRIGPDYDWKNVVAAYGPQALLLKTNGTLWRLGTNTTLWTERTWPGLGTFTPQRLGTDSDWAEIFSSPSHRTILRKTAGETWVTPAVSVEEEKMKLQPDLTIHRASYFDAYRTTTELFGLMGLFSVGIRDDGTFRLAATMGWIPHRGRGVSKTGMSITDIPLNSETNWLAVGGNLDHALTLRSDGTLWKWIFPDSGGAVSTPVRFNQHSDWVAIVPVLGGLVSLAADGGLWFWQFEPGRSSENQTPSLLRTSRRNQFVGNVFAATSQ